MAQPASGWSLPRRNLCSVRWRKRPGECVKQQATNTDAPAMDMAPTPGWDKQGETKSAKATELEEIVVVAKRPLSSSDEVREQGCAGRAHDTVIEILQHSGLWWPCGVLLNE